MKSKESQNNKLIKEKVEEYNKIIEKQKSSAVDLKNTLVGSLQQQDIIGNIMNLISNEVKRAKTLVNVSDKDLKAISSVKLIIQEKQKRIMIVIQENFLLKKENKELSDQLEGIKLQNSQSKKEDEIKMQELENKISELKNSISRLEENLELETTEKEKQSKIIEELQSKQLRDQKSLEAIRNIQISLKYLKEDCLTTLNTERSENLNRQTLLENHMKTILNRYENVKMVFKSKTNENEMLKKQTPMIKNYIDNSRKLLITIKNDFKMLLSVQEEYSKQVASLKKNEIAQQIAKNNNKTQEIHHLILHFKEFAMELNRKIKDEQQYFSFYQTEFGIKIMECIQLKENKFQLLIRALKSAKIKIEEMKKCRPDIINAIDSGSLFIKCKEDIINQLNNRFLDKLMKKKI